MVRGEQGLLVRFVPHHKVQGSGTLMRKDMLVKDSSSTGTIERPATDGYCHLVFTSNYTSFS